MYRHVPTCPKNFVPRNRLAWLFDATPETERDAIRVDLVERVRREIAEGTYETPEKWAAALGRLALDVE